MATDRIRTYIERSRRRALAELQPTPAQLERGLALHRDAVVCDMMGGVSYHNPNAGLYSRRMRHQILARLSDETDAVARKERLRAALRELALLRPFEFAADRMLQQEDHAVWDAAGVTIGVSSIDNAAVTVGGGYAKTAAFVTFINDHVAHVEKLLRIECARRLKAEGKHALIWHWHDAPNEGESLEYLNILYGIGLRSCGFTHGHDNRWVCGQFTKNDTGLKEAGREAIGRMNELGILADLAHCSPDAMLDLVETSADPVVVSHTGCRHIAVVKSKPDYQNRNVTDAALRAVADKGGVVGIGKAEFLTGGTDIESFMRHIDHAVNVAGVNHVGIGSDSSFSEPIPAPDDAAAFSDPDSGATETLSAPTALSWVNWPYDTTLALVCRGYRDEDIRKIIGANHIRILEQVLAKIPRGSLFCGTESIAP